MVYHAETIDLEMLMNAFVKLAVDIAGGGSNTELAKLLGVTQSAVSMWKSGERQVGPRHCKAIQRLTKGKVKAKDLRPDVFL